MIFLTFWGKDGYLSRLLTYWMRSATISLQGMYSPPRERHFGIVPFFVVYLSCEI